MSKVSPLSFEDILYRLQKFWLHTGCLKLQPMDVAVREGIFHPDVFLRAIGPEPWRAVFVQPVRRPAKADAPATATRLQRFYQFQVVLKPVPTDLPELCLQSLSSLGISAPDYKIQFVDREWISPAFGVRRQGQEVWVNEVKIARCASIQEVGDLSARPITGEITYGVERLAQLLQGCDNIFNIYWKDSTHTSGGDLLTYGHMHSQSEQENFAYGLSRPDNNMFARHFDDYENVAWGLLNKKPILPLPAYELVIKCAALYNIIEAGSPSALVAQKNYVGRIRKLTHAVATEYLQGRRAAGFPLLQANFVK